MLEPALSYPEPLGAQTPIRCNAGAELGDDLPGPSPAHATAGGSRRQIRLPIADRNERRSKLRLVPGDPAMFTTDDANRMTDALVITERVRNSIGLGESHFREFKSGYEGSPGAKVKRPWVAIARDVAEAM